MSNIDPSRTAVSLGSFLSLSTVKMILSQCSTVPSAGQGDEAVSADIPVNELVAKRSDVIVIAAIAAKIIFVLVFDL